MRELRTALITGARGGIGVAMVRVFRNAGYRVIATDRLPPASDDEAYMQFDIAKVAEDGEYYMWVLSELASLIGDERLDVLVNNAAIQIVGRTEDVAVEDMRATINTNVIGPFLLVQGLLGHLEAAGGSVVNVSSVHAVVTKPGFVSYATSKTALVGLTRSLAVDLGPRVRVNCVLPGATDTPMLRSGFLEKPEGLAQLAAMHPIGRIADASEVAEVVLFLASRSASWITGAAIPVDGGIGGRLHDPV